MFIPSLTQSEWNIWLDGFQSGILIGMILGAGALWLLAHLHRKTRRLPPP